MHTSTQDGHMPEVWVACPPSISQFYKVRDKLDEPPPQEEPYTVVISGTSTGIATAEQREARRKRRLRK